MLRSTKIKPFALFAFFTFTLLFIGTLAFGITPTPVMPASARPPAGIDANSSVTWGVDINVGSGQNTGLRSGADAYIRRKDHIIEIDPTNPGHITAAYGQIDIGYESNYANSTDAGLTWARGIITDFNSYTSGGNTGFSYDGFGTGYYSSMAITDTGNAIFVYTSTTGVSWSTPLTVAVYPNSEYRFLPVLTVDKRVSGQYAGSPYIFYENYESNDPFYLGIWGKYSRDGGVTWASEVPVSDPAHNYAHGPTAVVASDGTVYAAFEFRPSNLIGNAPELYLDRSTDGGATWGTDRLISDSPIEAMGAPDWKVRELTLPVLQNETCNMLRINHYPSIAVSPTDSNVVYAVWNDGRWDTAYPGCAPGNGKHSDIAFSKTTDGGLTWTNAIRVNDDTKGNGIDQFMPTVQVSPSGTVGIAYYDRRYSPNNVYYDLSYNESTDGGTTWSATQRVSDTSSDPDRLIDIKGIDDIGIRKSLVYGPDYALPSWVDTRLGVQQGEFFADRGTVPTVTPTPTIPTATSTPTMATPTTVPTSTPTACTLQFEDVPNGSTFYPFVQCLACQGILTGYTCGGIGEPCIGPGNYPYFRPSATITRGQLAKVVSNSAGFSDPISAQTFEDVPPGSTFYDFIGRLVLHGVMNGYPCGNPEPCIAPGNLPYFRPNNNATRGQISKIVALAASLNDPPGTRTFEDVVEGSTFYTFTQQLAHLGVMSGYPCGNPEPCVAPDSRPYFRPNNNATRGQVSKIVSNTFFPTCALVK